MRRVRIAAALAGAALAVGTAIAPANADTKPPAAPAFNALASGVSCPAANSCWAILNGAVPMGYRPGVLHWTGRRWNFAPLPVPTGLDPRHGVVDVRAITCTSAASCTIVGDYFLNQAGKGNSRLDRYAAWRWNGRRWSLLAVAIKDPGNQRLNGVACAAASDCWAIGSYFPPRGAAQARLLHYDGTRWEVARLAAHTIPVAVACNGGACNVAMSGRNLELGLSNFRAGRLVSSSDSGTTASVYASMSCVSSVSCWLVDGNVAVHFDGASWVSTSVPVPGRLSNLSTTSISCVGDTDCWAVGGYDVTGATQAPLIFHWNGTDWLRVKAPPTRGKNGGLLRSVSCADARHCTATGAANDGVVNVNGSNIPGSHILHYRWTGTHWV